MVPNVTVTVTVTAAGSGFKFKLTVRLGGQARAARLSRLSRSRSHAVPVTRL